MPFQFQRLEIPDIVLVEAQSIGDHRGSFLETYRMSSFAANGISDAFVQDNLSHSHHAKLVQVITGEIFDVAVDIRKGSPTHGRWVGMTLSADSYRMLYIPAGFAHGFCVMSEEAAVSYKATEEYAPDLERGIAWNDPDIGIRWPIESPILSAKDAQLPLLREADNSFEAG